MRLRVGIAIRIAAENRPFWVCFSFMCCKKLQCYALPRQRFSLSQTVWLSENCRVGGAYVDAATGSTFASLRLLQYEGLATLWDSKTNKALVLRRASSKRRLWRCSVQTHSARWSGICRQLWRGHIQHHLGHHGVHHDFCYSRAAVYRQLTGLRDAGTLGTKVSIVQDCTFTDHLSILKFLLSSDCKIPLKCRLPSSFKTPIFKCLLNSDFKVPFAIRF